MRQTARGICGAGFLALLTAGLGGCGLTRGPAPEPIARRVADRVLLDFPKPPPFDWGEGVLMAGMMHAGITFDEPRYIDFVRAWADHWIAKGVPAILQGAPESELKKYCGHWGPGYPVMLLHERTGQAVYRDTALQIADFILHEADRAPSGGLGHWAGNQELWVDTLYMVGPVFTRLTRATGDPAYLNEAVRQLDIYVRATQDRDSGLFYHMYDEVHQRIVGVLWARGNGWVALTLADVLAGMPREMAAFGPLRDSLHRQIAGLLKVRRASTGLWPTILDDPDSYDEASASAMILAAMIQAREAGLVDDIPAGVIRSSWRGLARKVSPEGRVIDVSGGTMPDLPEVYASKIKGTYTWGTGAFLIAASALEEADDDTRAGKP